MTPSRCLAQDPQVSLTALVELHTLLRSIASAPEPHGTTGADVSLLAVVRAGERSGYVAECVEIPICHARSDDGRGTQQPEERGLVPLALSLLALGSWQLPGRARRS